MSLTQYAVEIDELNKALRIIVGTADWAVENLGGVWVDYHEKVGIGWEYYGGIFRPPSPYPSWFWAGDDWIAPRPIPEEGVWIWSEDEFDWVEIS